MDPRGKPGAPAAVDHPKILIFGIGNPGRGDDGLGPALLEALRGGQETSLRGGNGSQGKAWGPGRCGADLEFRYQLNVEDALAIRDYDVIIFADAIRGDAFAATAAKGRAVAAKLAPRAKPGAPAAVDSTADRTASSPKAGPKTGSESGKDGVLGPIGGECDEGVWLAKIEPSSTIAFTTHKLPPASVLALCQELYGITPRAYVLAMRGYVWDLGESLSKGAARNLEKATNLLNKFLSDRRPFD